MHPDEEGGADNADVGAEPWPASGFNGTGGDAQTHQTHQTTQHAAAGPSAGGAGADQRVIDVCAQPSTYVQIQNQVTDVIHILYVDFRNTGQGLKELVCTALYPDLLPSNVQLFHSQAHRNLNEDESLQTQGVHSGDLFFLTINNA